MFRGGDGLGNFQQKVPPQQKWLEKIMQGDQGGMKGLPMMLRVKNTCFHTATSRKWRFSRVKYRFFGWIVCFFL